MYCALSLALQDEDDMYFSLTLSVQHVHAHQSTFKILNKGPTPSVLQPNPIAPALKRVYPPMCDAEIIPGSYAKSCR